MTAPSSVPYIVTEPGILSLTATPVDITTCTGDNSGSIIINITGSKVGDTTDPAGGTAPYEIYFINGEDNPTVTTQTGYYVFNGLAAVNNLYKFRVTDANGCIYPADGSFVGVNIQEPNALNLDVTRYQYAQMKSDGSVVEDNGQIEFELSGGVVASGKHNYQIVLTGTNGGSSYTNVKRPQYQTVGGTGSDRDAEKPVKFSWMEYDASGNAVDADNDNTTLSWVRIPAGDYTITVTDLNSPDRCSVSKSFSINALKLTNEDVQMPSCSSNEGDGMITIDVTGNSGDLNFSWQKQVSDATGATAWSTLTEFDNLKVANALYPGTYRLVVTDNGDDDLGGKVTDYQYLVKDFVLDNSKQITFGTPAITKPTCSDSNDGSIKPVVITDGNVDASALSYNWSGVGGFSSTDKDISGLNKATTSSRLLTPTAASPPRPTMSPRRPRYASLSKSITPAIPTAAPFPS